MKSEWNRIKLGDAVLFNPTEKITKGNISKKVAMDKLTPFSRHIDGFDITEYNGGSKFRNGDTLLARITPCLENGKTAQVSILDDNEIGFGSTEFIVLREKTGVSNRDYIYYLAIDNEFRDKAIKSMVGSSGRQRVQQDILEKMDISLPPLSEQKAIAETLSCLDDKIELNNRINKNLEAQAQAIFKSWFVDFEPFQNGEFIDSELGKIPKGWRITPFTQDISILGGGTPKTDNVDYWDGNIPFFTPKDSTNSFYTLNTEKHISELGIKKCNSRLFDINTVFVTVRGTVGKIALAGIPMAMNQSCYALISKKLGQIFVHQLAMYIMKRLAQKANGAVFSALVTRDFESEFVCIPSTEIIKKYTDLVLPLYDSILSYKKQNQTLATLRDTLLPKLMSGEIEIPQEV